LFVALIFPFIDVHAHDHCDASSKSNIEIVKKIYAAFGKGDIKTLLNGLTKDCKFQLLSQSEGYFQFQNYDGIVPLYFENIGKNLDFKRYEVKGYYSGENGEVVTYCEADVVNRLTGKSGSYSTFHKFTLNGDGLVTSLVEQADTASLLNLDTQGQTQYDNEIVGTRLFKAFNEKNYALVEELSAPNAKFYGWGPSELDVKGLTGFMSNISGAFTGSKFQFISFTADSNEVSIRHKFTGVHTHNFMGIAPTNKPVSVDGICNLVIRKGKIVEAHLNANFLGMMIQIGAMPPPKA